jgi:ATP-dependent Clp protease ATP-binding subunit ClpC
VFERFSDHARRVVVLAQEEARALGHDYIGTEHILLGLLHNSDATAGRVLATLKVTPEAVRERVGEYSPPDDKKPGGHVPFSPRAKKTLELSLREALQLGHNYIGSGHILLGLIREERGTAAKVLSELGVELEAARNLVGDPGEHAESQSPSPGVGPGPLSVVAGRLTAIEERLSAIEERLTAIERRWSS